MADNPNVGGGKIRPRRATSTRKPYSRASTQRKCPLQSPFQAWQTRNSNQVQVVELCHHLSVKFTSFLSKVSDSFKSFLNPITPRWLLNFQAQEEPQSSEQIIEPGSQETNSRTSEPLNNNSVPHRLSRPPLRNFQAPSTSSQSCRPSSDVLPGEDTQHFQSSSMESGKEGLLKHLTMASKKAKMDTESPLVSDSSFLRNEMKLLSTNDTASVASSSECSSSVRMGSQKADFSDNESIGKNMWNSKESSRSTRQQATMSSSRRPRFNPAMFGMPALGVSSPDPHQSSFYEGAVQFGGANSSGRSPYFATPYKIPSVTKVKVRHVNHQKTANKSAYIPSRNATLPLDESMSSTARKILQTLEKISSPLNDARKIPTMPRTPSSYAADRSRRRMHDSTLLHNSSTAPPITGLSSPSSAKLRRRTQGLSSGSLLMRKEKEAPPHRTETVTNKRTDVDNLKIPDSRAIAARGLPAPIASMSSSAEMSRPNTHSPFATPNSSGGGGKMRSQKRSSAHYKSSQNLEEEEPEQPPLLLNVTLPVSSLPSFNFAAKGMTSTPAAVKPSEITKRVHAADSKFSFSSPIVKTSQSGQAGSTSETPKFQFSSPVAKQADNQDALKGPQPLQAFSSGSKKGASPLMFAPDPKVVSAVKSASRKSSPAVSPNNSQSCITTERLKKGSVMDILGGKTKEGIEATGSNQPSVLKVNKKSDSTAPNNDSASTTPMSGSSTKPAFCASSSGGFKPTPTFSFGVSSKKENNAMDKTVSFAGFGSTCIDSGTTPASALKIMPASKPTKDSSLKPISSGGNKGWTCDVCLLSNDAECEKCVACTAPKPGSVSKKTTSKPWTCGICLVPNDATCEKCVACTAPKPGPVSKKTTSKAWTCGICLVPNDATCAKCAACETPKPGSSSGGFKSAMSSHEKPTFSFGIASKSNSKTSGKVSTGFGNTISTSKTASPVTFQFGAPTTKSSDTTSLSASTKAGWSDFGKKRSSTWECEVCMVPNSDERKTCEACESPKPGTKAASNTSFKYGENSSGLFKSGATDAAKGHTSETATQTSQSVATTKSTAMADQSSKPSFSFGAPATASLKPPSITTFGSGNKTDEGKTLSFSFGQKSAETTQLKGKEKSGAPQTPSFQFDAPAKVNLVPSTSAVGKPETSQNILTQFGSSDARSSVSKSTPVAPTVSTKLALIGNTGGASQSVPVPAFGTVSTTASAQLQPSKPSLLTGLSSGANQDSQVKPADSQSLPQFAFGTKSTSSLTNQTDSKTVAPTFGFGGKPAGPLTNQTDSKSATPTFGFGAKQAGPQTSSSIPATAPPSYSFGSKPAGSTAFGSGATAGQTENKSTVPQFGSGIQTASSGHASPFGAPGKVTPFSAFGKPVESNNTQKSNEPAKPVFGGFNAGTSSNDAEKSKPVFGGFNVGTGANDTQKSTPAKPVFGGFGATAVSTNNQKSASTPIFGGFGASDAPKSDPVKPVFGGFNTGASAPSSQSTASQPTSGIPFGGSTASAVPAFGTSSTATKAAFGGGSSNVFGAGEAPSAGFGSSASNKVFGGSSNEGQSKSVFGQSPASSNHQFGSSSGSAAKPGGFAFGGSGSQTQTSGFQFGSSQQPTAAQPNASFNFGGSPAPSNNSGSNGFNFGAAQAAQSNGVFQFGGSNANTGSSAGFNFSGSATPSFNFSGGNQQSGVPAAGAAAPVFGGGAPSQNPFDQQLRATTPAQGRRVIKTARRKLRK